MHIRKLIFLLVFMVLLVGCGISGSSGSNDDSSSEAPNIIAPPNNNIPVADSKDVNVSSGGAVDILLSSSDADSDTLTYGVVSDPIFGTLDITNLPTVTYTPSANYGGNDSFTYKVNDDTADSKTVIVSIEVLKTVATAVSISGVVTYDHIPIQDDHVGLDYNNINTRTVKQIVVEAIDSSGFTLTSTTTDDNGAYTLSNLPINTVVRVRVRAQMRQASTSIWDTKVIHDSTKALYAIVGALQSTGTSNSTRDLHAVSGWDGTKYVTTERVAAPFAMLDSIYSAMKKVLVADSGTTFPPLLVNWSVSNVINGTYYTNGNIFVLGDEDGDTDEYDDHVIAHEWTHYYEDKLSRSDSTGGSHSLGDRLDIRIAFGEGFGNAMSAIALDDPVYADTSGVGQSSGFFFNVETGVSTGNSDGTAINPGWYSEGSIQRIIYDLYDSNADAADNIALGFGSLHNVFISAQKTTPAFTSIFTFITALKAQETSSTSAIDSVVSSESIATIVDIYGTGRSNLSNETPLYVDLSVGGTVNVCPTYTYGSFNKLGSRKYVRLNVNTAGNYTILVSKSIGSTDTDPDFLLFNASSSLVTLTGISDTVDVESVNADLVSASYLLDILDFETVVNACFDVSIN